MNESLTYGRNIVGHGCCYHHSHGQAWLMENGLNVCKAGSIEIYDINSYMQDCDYWGRGGVLMHELSHAYHNKHIVDGFENKCIREVSVHRVCVCAFIRHEACTFLKTACVRSLWWFTECCVGI